MAGRFEKAYSSLVSNGNSPSPDSYMVVNLEEDLDNWFVGIDDQSNPCILVQSSSVSGRQPLQIKLENLDVQFHVPCKVEKTRDRAALATCSVLRLKSDDEAIRSTFFSVCDSIASILGNVPKDLELSKAMRKLATIFRKMLQPPSRTVAGLFGELSLIHRSRLPHELIRDWREADGDRYDFSSHDLKVEVKSSSARQRIHEFSYEQCSPPAGSTAIVTSIFVERASRGTSVDDLRQLIEKRIAGRPTEIFKLREIIIETLGASQSLAKDIAFDLNLATQSAAFFDLHSIPAIRGNPPPNVTKIRFVTDLSDCVSLNITTLADSQPCLTAYMEFDDSEP